MCAARIIGWIDSMGRFLLITVKKRVLPWTEAHWSSSSSFLIVVGTLGLVVHTQYAVVHAAWPNECQYLRCKPKQLFNCNTISTELKRRMHEHANNSTSFNRKRDKFTREALESFELNVRNRNRMYRFTSLKIDQQNNDVQLPKFNTGCRLDWTWLASFKRARFLVCQLQCFRRIAVGRIRISPHHSFEMSLEQRLSDELFR